MSLPGRPGQSKPSVEPSGTLIETDEEIRQAIIGGLKPHPQPPAPVDRVSAAPPEREPPDVPVPGGTTSPFRPTARPPVALLTVLDDGKNDGELIRIRNPKFVIGRSEGDLRIPIDGRISSRHVEITLQTIGGLNRWVVTDLQSRHGMFVRVSRAALSDRSEFLVGNGRYLFETPSGRSDATVDSIESGRDFNQTKAWTDGPGPIGAPAVTELIQNEIGNRMLLFKSEYWIGSDPACSIHRGDDPFCEPKHVRLFRGPSGAWQAEHNRTLNGLWVRMSQIIVDSPVRFQIGEQRFQVKV